MPGGGGTWPRIGSLPQVGFSDVTPQKFAGVRSDPPMSDPISSGVMPVASAAAAPPDDQPGTRVTS
jgi:hypothetical protein